MRGTLVLFRSSNSPEVYSAPTRVFSIIVSLPAVYLTPVSVYRSNIFLSSAMVSSGFVTLWPTVRGSS